MCTIADYDVPRNVLNIEQNQSKSDGEIAPELEQMHLLKPLRRTNESKYFASYTMMIHLEEAAQSRFVVQFNHQNIQLIYSGSKRVFHIKNEVSSNIVFFLF